MQGGKGLTLAQKKDLTILPTRKAGPVHHLLSSFDPGVLKTSHMVDHTLPSE